MPANLQPARDVFQGSALHRLLEADGDISRMRTNTLLTEEQWRQIDDVVIQAAEDRLRIVADMRSAGLIHRLGGFGVLESEFHKLSDITPAEQSMSGATRGEKDLPDTSIAIIPIPVTFKEFSIEARTLLSSRRRGEPLDTSTARLAGRQVAEKLEDMVINGGDIVLGGNSIPGLTTFVDRNQYTGITDWTTDSGAVILADVLAMIDLLHLDLYFGPYRVYVAKNYWLPLMDDFKAESDKTIMQRLLELPDIVSINVLDKLAASEVLMIQMTPDVLDLAVGMEVDTVDWETQGGALQHFKVMAAMAPRLKSDYNARTGICHGT